MVCYHIDGNVGNNHPENLGTKCQACDMLCNCGLHSTKFHDLEAYTSRMSQRDIVRKTRDALEANDYLRMPTAHDIDPEAVLSEDMTITDVANILSKKRYSHLEEVAAASSTASSTINISGLGKVLCIRGFFTDDALERLRENRGVALTTRGYSFVEVDD